MKLVDAVKTIAREKIIHPAKDKLTYLSSDIIDTAHTLAETYALSERVKDASERAFYATLDRIETRMENGKRGIVDAALRYNVVGYQAGIVFGNYFIWKIHDDPLHKGKAKAKTGDVSEFERLISEEHWKHHGTSLSRGMVDYRHVDEYQTGVNDRMGSKYFKKQAGWLLLAALVNPGFAIGTSATLLHYGYAHNRGHTNFLAGLKDYRVHVDHHLVAGHIDWLVDGTTQKVRKQDLNRGVFDPRWDNIMGTRGHFWDALPDTRKEELMKRFIDAMLDTRKQIGKSTVGSPYGPDVLASQLQRMFEPNRQDRVWDEVNNRLPQIVHKAVQKRPFLQQLMNVWDSAADDFSDERYQQEQEMFFSLLHSIAPEFTEPYRNQLRALHIALPSN